MTVAPQQLYTFRSSYTKLTYSKDDLRGLVTQIESSFVKTDIYGRALSRLQERLGSTTNGIQALVNALGREAIRLTIRELISSVTNHSAKKSPKVKVSSSTSSMASNHNFCAEVQSLSVTEQNSQHNSQQSKDIFSTLSSQQLKSQQQGQSIDRLGIAISIPDYPVLADECVHASASEQSALRNTSSNTATGKPEPLPRVDNPEPVIAPPSLMISKQPPRPSHISPPSRKVSSKKSLPEPSTDREKALLAIGQQLYQARIQQNLSVAQLHQRTCVPGHHIRALEDGIWQNLPEDIYLQGFIRLLGNAVGLNGQDLSQKLSDLALEKQYSLLSNSRATQKLSSNHRSNRSTSRSTQLKPSHLYLGYAALMAGATGGLAWMVHQPTTVSDSLGQTANSSNQLNLLDEHHPEHGAMNGIAHKVFQQINAIATPETTLPEKSSHPANH
ncbi:MAG: helix-turn-helix domain-containing protein [Cyanobacteria bacterium P01_F01_bin.150]